MKKDMRNDNKSLNEALDLMHSEVKDIFVDELQISIDRAIEKAKGEAYAHVESAVKLDKTEKEKLSDLLLGILKRKINIDFAVKPNLLGGFRVRVGDWRLDGTILHQLDKMRGALGGTSI